jgi:hypothetical protein
VLDDREDRLDEFYAIVVVALRARNVLALLIYHGSITCVAFDDLIAGHAFPRNVKN